MSTYKYVYQHIIEREQFDLLYLSLNLINQNLEISFQFLMKIKLLIPIYRNALVILWEFYNIFSLNIF